MCVACGLELCKHCKGCHNTECERYKEPTDTCETKEGPNRTKSVESEMQRDTK